MNNFSVENFMRIWTYLDSLVWWNWKVGRGKRCILSGKDVLFMMITTLKNARQWVFYKDV